MSFNIPEYVKMCKKAKEIQKNWIPKTGDILAKEINKYSFAILVVYLSYNATRIKDYIWLPTQEQLQKMIFKNVSVIFMLNGFYKWCMENLEYINQFTTMEELWLAYVMYEKYSKIWDNKKGKWIKKKGVKNANTRKRLGMH